MSKTKTKALNQTKRRKLILGLKRGILRTNKTNKHKGRNRRLSKINKLAYIRDKRYMIENSNDTSLTEASEKDYNEDINSKDKIDDRVKSLIMKLNTQLNIKSINSTNMPRKKHKIQKIKQLYRVQRKLTL